MLADFEERVANLRERLLQLGGVFDLDNKQRQIPELEATTQQPGFWDDRERAQELMRTLSSFREDVQTWNDLNKRLEDIEVLAQLAEEEQDSQAEAEVASELRQLEQAIEKIELETILAGEDDAKSAILTIHPGAGGTESQDWAQMLMRMYLRWIERRGFTGVVMDVLPGEEAGIKSATIEVQGKYAYGYLKAEAGVHRLVRLSPFDFNNRRHTSFASVFVYPEVENDVEIHIDPNDLRIDTFRASGAGGQHVNKTSSAVRITHIPTGIVVQCQSERSQHRNKDFAMKILMARLYQKKKEEEQERLEKIESTKREIGWGNQIRSYVLHPYNLVKDHRTGVETSNTQAVLDGEIDEFIRAYLLQQRDGRKAA
ncbi:MAG: peptide chain release factor 2 [bacterium]|nr:peptide chain release factor 2 [candidate division KSB1 bacterium]MDH7560671.1 peptide chain release factor 2 [bacterium]